MNKVSTRPPSHKTKLLRHLDYTIYWQFSFCINKWALSLFLHTLLPSSGSISPTSFPSFLPSLISSSTLAAPAFLLSFVSFLPLFLSHPFPFLPLSPPLFHPNPLLPLPSFPPSLSPFLPLFYPHPPSPSFNYSFLLVSSPFLFFPFLSSVLPLFLHLFTSSYLIKQFKCICVHWFCSSDHSFIHSFTYSFIHSFIRPFTHHPGVQAVQFSTKWIPLLLLKCPTGHGWGSPESGGQ